MFRGRGCTSDWQDSTERVSSCNWVRISQRAGHTTGPISSDVCSWMACVWLPWLLLAAAAVCWCCSSLGWLICIFIKGWLASDMNGSDGMEGSPAPTPADPAEFNCCSSSSEWSKRVAFITLIGGGSWKAPPPPPPTPTPPPIPSEDLLSLSL